MLPIYKKKVVAFIDILGFKGLIEQLEENEDIHKKVHLALSRIKFVKDSSSKEYMAQAGLNICVFSDSVVITSDHNKLHNVLWSAIRLQCHLLELGVLARGGISIGSMVHEGDMLYGKGLIKAYELESKSAIYPRILVDEQIVKELASKYKKIFLKQDKDSLWFLNPFSIGILPSCSDELVADGYDPYEVAFNELEKTIESNIQKAANPNHLMKWAWFKSEFDQARAEFKINGKPIFWKHFDELHKKNA